MLRLSYGNKAPEIVNVVIEIRKGERNKYELDKETGMLTLDRVGGTTMGFPTDYGYVPNTMCEDGDAIDVLVIIDESLPDGVLVKVRPVGVLRMVDTGEKDEKIIGVAANDETMGHVKSVDDLDPNFRQRIEHYFSHYKDWKNDWKGVEVHFNGWGDAEDAKKVIQESIDRAQA